MKHLFILIISLFIVACGTAYIEYTPKISNVKDPISTIKTTLEEQPPAYAYVPAKVEVTERCITLYMVEQGSGFPFRGGGTVVPTNYYFRNLGAPKLSDSPIWGVVIYDDTGYDLYYSYMNSEKEAKEFINALTYLISKNK